MYRYTFDLKRSSEAARLSLVSDNQTLVFNELINFALQRLEILSIYLDAANDPQGVSTINPSFSKIVDFTGVSGIFCCKTRQRGLSLEFDSEGFTPDLP